MRSSQLELKNPFQLPVVAFEQAGRQHGEMAQTQPPDYLCSGAIPFVG
jgi:hypothetical protein